MSQKYSVRDILDRLLKSVQVAPCRNGQIAVKMGTCKEVQISFLIDHNVVLDATEAALKFAEELKQKEVSNAAAQAASQSLGGE